MRALLSARGVPRPATADGPLAQTLPGTRLSVPFALLSPAVVTMLAGSAFVLAYAFYLSLTDYNLLRSYDVKWVGLGNYTSLLGSSQFWGAARFSVLFMLAALALELVLGGGIAILLRDSWRLGGLLRTTFLLPMMVAPLVAGYAWRFMFNPQQGLVNWLLGLVGIAPVAWLSDPAWAPRAILVAEVWQWTPFVFLLIYAGLQSLPEEVQEAAALDGFSWWQTLRYVYLPLLRPLLVLVCLIRGIDLLRIFDSIYVMTQGGPGTATQALVIYSYRLTFTQNFIGLGAAVAFLILVAVAAPIVVFFRQLSARAA